MTSSSTNNRSFDIFVEVFLLSNFFPTSIKFLTNEILNEDTNTKHVKYYGNHTVLISIDVKENKRIIASPKHRLLFYTVLCLIYAKYKLEVWIHIFSWKNDWVCMLQSIQFRFTFECHIIPLCFRKSFLYNGVQTKVSLDSDMWLQFLIFIRAMLGRWILYKMCWVTCSSVLCKHAYFNFSDDT